jgi:hypothetical protein
MVSVVVIIVQPIEKNIGPQIAGVRAKLRWYGFFRWHCHRSEIQKNQPVQMNGEIKTKTTLMNG